MPAFDDVFDGLEDPAPEGDLAANDKNLKGRLPLRSALVVDSKKYQGQRISRYDADIALVEVEPDSNVPDVSIGEDEEGIEKLGNVENKLYPIGEEASDEDTDEKEAEIRKEEEAIAARLADEKAREVKRADAVKHQKSIYDSIVDVRIRLEQVINAARGFPSIDDRKDVAQWESFTADVEDVRNTLDSLNNLTESIDKSFRRCCPDTVHTESGTSFTKWRDSIMDKWGRKVNEAEGLTPKGGFKAIDASLSGQLRATLSTGKHIKKSRKVRSSIPLHGDVGEIPVGVNELHYDDRELYRSLLQEIIESGDGEGGGLRYAQLAKSGKVKKKIDRSGSKGRKLRYVVHDKLIGFLAPIPLSDPGPIDEIIAGMFGAVKS